MSKEKQIEETTELLWHFPKALHLNCYNDCYEVAELLYDKGYRKQSEGRWVVTGTERAWNNAEYPIERSCSVCGLRRNIETQEAWNFCPNCGAKMLKGENTQ